MASRILNRQRQLAEQGRLRLGTYEATTNGKMRPKASHTWIVTSHWEEYVRVAAELWGGEAKPYMPQGHGAQGWRVITEAQSIDAILPPFEPLQQAYELWSAGGCQRRCDGATEQFTGAPCLCIAQYGEEWHTQPAGKVCDTKSRLKVLLPEMPGMGSWRLETGSYYAADELAGMVDGIRVAVGPNVLVPVKLRIEQRHRIAGGQTKQFIVPVLDLRDITAGQLLGGQYQGLASLEQAREERKAIEGNHDVPRLDNGIPDYVELAHEAGDLEAVRQIWHLAEHAGHLTEDLRRQLTEIGQSFNPAGPEVEVMEDPDVVWQEVLRVTGGLSMDYQQVMDDFPTKTGGVAPETATGADMRRYIAALHRETAS